VDECKPLPRMAEPLNSARGREGRNKDTQSQVNIQPSLSVRVPEWNVCRVGLLDTAEGDVMTQGVPSSKPLLGVGLSHTWQRDATKTRKVNTSPSRSVRVAG